MFGAELMLDEPPVSLVIWCDLFTDWVFPALAIKRRLSCGFSHPPTPSEVCILYALWLMILNKLMINWESTDQMIIQWSMNELSHQILPFKLMINSVSQTFTVKLYINGPHAMQHRRWQYQACEGPLRWQKATSGTPGDTTLRTTLVSLHKSASRWS